MAEEDQLIKQLVRDEKSAKQPEKIEEKIVKKAKFDFFLSDNNELLTVGNKEINKHGNALEQYQNIEK